VVLEGLTERASPRTYRRVLDELAGRTMPPDQAKRFPSASEVAAVTSSINAAMREVLDDPGRVTLRRLNRTEYNNTVRDLFGVTGRPADAFPDDDTGYGFDTIGDVLSLSPVHFERMLKAAEEVAAEAVLVYSPVKKRVEAERMRKTARGGRKGGWARFTTRGVADVQVHVPHSGEYALRARAYGDQAGPERAKMAFRVDGRRVAVVTVPATREAPDVYEVRAKLTEGEHVLGVEFTNDYYNPKDPDRGNRDRNLSVDYLELEGPAEPPNLPRLHAEFLGKDGPALRSALEGLLLRVYRRPARAEEVDALLALHGQVLSEGDSPQRALQVVLQAMLVSPHFLFRLERDPEPGERWRELDEYELATRLACFLWSSTPDDALLARARAGTLRENLRAEVARMIDDPRSSALVESFTGQWLELRRLETLTPDPKAFPAFDETLRAAMVEETERFFEAVLREDRSALDFLRGRFTFVNGPLAKHYGIRGITGPRFRRVTLPPQRSGILTRASILTLTSNPTRTSPVKRGKWVLEVLLDKPPPPPPADVPSLPDRSPKGEVVAIRELMREHRKNPVCASCHRTMDPLGFGLENFNGVGRFRLRDGKFAVDASGKLPGGVTFEGPLGLRDHLLTKRKAFVMALARKLLTYGLGRGFRDADEPAVEALVESLAPDYRLGELIQGLVRLDAFQRRGRAK
jgi:hypothetical protein